MLLVRVWLCACHSFVLSVNTRGGVVAWGRVNNPLKSGMHPLRSSRSSNYQVIVQKLTKSILT